MNYLKHRCSICGAPQGYGPGGQTHFYLHHRGYGHWINEDMPVAARQETASNIGTKHDSDKPLLQYIPPLAIMHVGKAFSAGHKKYGAWNYRSGLAATRCVGGALRHTFQWMAGQDNDDETGVHHLACAVANLLMALENVLLNPNMDDRHKPQIDTASKQPVYSNKGDK